MARLLALLALAAGPRTGAAASGITFSGSHRSTNLHDYDTVYRYNPATKTTTLVNGTGQRPPGSADFVSGAAVCGTPRTRYAIWTDMSSGSWGMTSTNLETGAQMIFETAVLYHSVWCHEGSGSQKLIAIGSESGNNGATFTVRLFDSAAPLDDTVLATLNFKGMLWSGQDTLFSHSAELGQVWAAFPTDSTVLKTGKIIAVNVGCPNCTAPKVYDMPLGGWPFLVYAGKQGRLATHSKSSLAGDVEDLVWSELTLPEEGGKAEIKKTSASVYAALGHPEGTAPNCNGTIYAFTNGGVSGSQVLNAVSADTGATLWTQEFSELSQKYVLGAIGCD